MRSSDLCRGQSSGEGFLLGNDFLCFNGIRVKDWDGNTSSEEFYQVLSQRLAKAGRLGFKAHK